MGLFCVNLHFRTADQTALEESLRRRGINDFHILAPKNGWTSLYEQRASDQDDRRIRDLGVKLSKDLNVACVAFLVHDSDIACYWLFDNGAIQDEYNSCPDYFGDALEDSGPSGGQADVLVRYCRSGVRENQLDGILNSKNLFAEAIIEQLATQLEIPTLRALADFRDFENGEFPDDEDGPFGRRPGFDDGGDEDDGDGPDDDGDSGGGRPNVLPFRKDKAGQAPNKDMMAQLQKMFSPNSNAAESDPKAGALVEAASKGDIAAIDGLLGEGVKIDAEGPGLHPQQEMAANFGVVIPGGLPKFPMTPLLAAVLHKQHQAAKRLLEGGADANRVSMLFGSSLHAAAGAGEAKLLEMLIEHGGDVEVRNLQGQTPLAVVAAGKANTERMAKAQEMMKTMGLNLPAGYANLVANIKLPTEGWEECERMLKAKMKQ